jgi:Spy/CpxP family protein refolding chaperone
MSPGLKLLRNAALGVLAGGGVLVAYETSALSQNEPTDTTQSQPRHHWGDHKGFAHYDGGFGMAMDGGFGRALKELNLSDDQKKSVQDIFTAARPEFDSMRQSMHTMVESLGNTMPDDPNYAAVVEQATRDSQQLAASMVKQASDLKTRLYGVLNADQKARLPAVIKQMQAEHASHRHGAAPATDSNE